jgi:hypothetical protein
MWGSILLYAALGLTGAGLAMCLKPIRRLRVPTRRRAALVAVSGARMVIVALALPASELRASTLDTRLDAAMPVWQFHEIHTVEVDAPADRVFDAVKRVRADERPLSPGFALAAMNFRVMPIAPQRSRLSTETRVFANSPGARRRFAVYWRVIYPGSALIRRMWLEAIARRAKAAGPRQ